MYCVVERQYARQNRQKTPTASSFPPWDRTTTDNFHEDSPARRPPAHIAWLCSRLCLVTFLPPFFASFLESGESVPHHYTSATRSRPYFNMKGTLLWLLWLRSPPSLTVPFRSSDKCTRFASSVRPVSLPSFYLSTDPTPECSGSVQRILSGAE